MVSKHTRYTGKPVTDDEYNLKCAKDRISHRDNNLKSKMSRWIPESIIPDILKNIKYKILESVPQSSVPVSHSSVPVSHSSVPVSQSISSIPVSQSISITPVSHSITPIPQFISITPVSHSSIPVSQSISITPVSQSITPIPQFISITPVSHSSIPVSQSISITPVSQSISITPVSQSIVPVSQSISITPVSQSIVPVSQSISITPVSQSISQAIPVASTTQPSSSMNEQVTYIVYQPEPIIEVVDQSMEVLSPSTNQCSSQPTIGPMPPSNIIDILAADVSPPMETIKSTKASPSDMQECHIKPTRLPFDMQECHIVPTRLPFDVCKILSSNTQESPIKPRITIATSPPCINITSIPTEQPISDYNLIDQWFNTPAWLEPSEFSSDEKAEPMPEDFISYEYEFLSDRKAESTPEPFLDKKVTPSKKIKDILSNMKLNRKSKKSKSKNV